MASQKDKDYHMLRNSDKYSELMTANGDTYGYLNKVNAEAYARYRKIWSKYGFKSMVSDRRRRNSTRKSNQKDKQMRHQIERAQFKANFKGHLLNQDNPLVTGSKMGSIYSEY
ncbi:hypothetical protein [Mucilaginibacter aquatilis]|uniref:Uncharacterized protein n=1 Tax=Mucilaginibacter aquatilis TaxID=1517760 RepID=A0A6I4IBU0_9SPHI|nr:hypothetical protein [Mucilaginibacter aquatilis]MVN92447.1 hypothetical protein [Mucilaginibacter aquatilis]